MKQIDSELYFLFERTVKNCIFYEREHDLIHFFTEVHCLRGIYYCIKSYYYLEGRDLLDKEDLDLFDSFIEASNLIFDTFEDYLQFLNMDFDFDKDYN